MPSFLRPVALLVELGDQGAAVACILPLRHSRMVMSNVVRRQTGNAPAFRFSAACSQLTQIKEERETSPHTPYKEKGETPSKKDKENTPRTRVREEFKNPTVEEMAAPTPEWAVAKDRCWFHLKKISLFFKAQ